ncbi:alpha-(1,6)-fucosyltransferase-like [Penaeus indicus]|uniref:alpha-(1,6)-fucosyltransferase-like n=1 Tax=Penaeus indicus TaxID=29960 RepID=UPI00300CE5E0
MAVDKLKRSVFSLLLLVLLYCSTIIFSFDTKRSSFSPSWGRAEGSHFKVDSGQMSKPLMEAEQMRQQVVRDVRYTWQFLKFHLRNLNSNTNSSTVHEDVEHYFRATSHDLTRLGEVDGFQEWREEEAAALSALVQHRLHVLQNPRDCASAKKIYCDFKAQGRGMGSHLHHLSYCFLASYGTQRTLILNTKGYNGNPKGLETFFLPLSETCTSYSKSQMAPWPGKKDSLVVHFPDWDRPNPRPKYFPKSIPKDISKRLMRLHGDPFAWWIGQFFKYAMRMNKDFQNYTDNLAREMGYESPVVGLQIRRSDKLQKEAVYIDLSVYMEEVDGFYKELELRQTVAQRRIFLATDDPEVIPEIKKKYPEYKLLYNPASVDSTRKSQRKKGPSVQYFLADVYFLSRSDYLVCGMTSNICRLSYELMQTLHVDASTRVSSVDRDYYFHYEVGNVVKARFTHKPTRTGELEMQEGDLVDRIDIPIDFSKHPSKNNGFQWGTNTRTKKSGYYPVYKTVEILEKADVQSFENIDRMRKTE